ENFRRPYLSETTSEFWSRRWHLSLTSWFRDYVYIRSEEHTSELQSPCNLVCRLLLEKKKKFCSQTNCCEGSIIGTIISCTGGCADEPDTRPCTLMIETHVLAQPSLEHENMTGRCMLL